MYRLQVHVIDVITVLLLLAPTTLCFSCFTGSRTRIRNLSRRSSSSIITTKGEKSSIHITTKSQSMLSLPSLSPLPSPFIQQAQVHCLNFHSPKQQHYSYVHTSTSTMTMTRMNSPRRGIEQEPTSTSTNTSTNNKTNTNTNTNTNINKIIQILQRSIQQLSYRGELWFLTAISILSGLSPAVEIISSSHLSRLPDCPIAHDIDTLLLWPATVTGTTTSAATTTTAAAAAATGTLSPPTIFQAPFAAITDESMYNVDWASVLNAYISNVEISFLLAFLISTSLVVYVDDYDYDYDDGSARL